ncbi:ferredoxin [Streptomyces sp. NPDC001435]|jgi:ferredoxin|uniref:ferredoxin n=1 Tax=unclassified Streptomyces TaxID=2593676 RepID=UPI0036A2DAAD
MRNDIEIDIDRDVCIGAGQCALAAPNVFTQDDDGYSMLVPGKEDGAGDPMVRDAARACPVGAIKVTEAATG